MAKIIDADSHMFEQPGVWREHMPASEQHLALDIEEDELGYSWLTHRGARLLQCYISEPGRLWESYGLPHQRCRDGEAALVRYGDMPATYKDPAARRDALDGWRIDEQVVFPNWGLNFGWYLDGDAEAERANIAAWNRWAAEIRADGAGRLRPVGHLTLRAGEEWTRRELECLAAAGITQVFLPAGLVDGRRMSHPDFDPVWSQMLALGLAPTFHIGAFAERFIADGWQSNDVIQYMTLQSLVMNGVEAQIAVSDLVLNGVFDRHPNLRWIVTEYSVGWLPELRFRLDVGYDIHHQVTGTHNVDLALRPSEYIDRHFRCVSFPHENPQAVMDATAENLMYGSDYPHAEGQLVPLDDYRRTVGDLGAREDAFYGGTFAAAVGD
jgi:predicted TIM-barrel fold metal-dependent hydrolase